MFAVLKTGGKQYRVAQGDVLRVERLACVAGEQIQFNEVLMLGGDTVTVGAPLIDDAAVQADVIDQIKGEKLIHYVKRRRKHSSQRTKGHRQKLTLVRVTGILASGAGVSGVKVAVGSGSASAETRAALSAPKGTVAKSTAKAKAAEPAKVEASGNGMSTAAMIAAAAGAAVVAGAAVAAGVAVARGASDDGETGTKPDNLLSEARNGKADDLKRITGVGPKLEGLLHENGVFHFDQIAAWSPDEVAFMDDSLSFKGRIARDGWIDQATAFAAEQE